MHLISIKLDQYYYKNMQNESKQENSSLIKNNIDSEITSYSALKILISILDCYNRILYLPNLSNSIYPDSISTFFYIGLIENMHGILNNINILKTSTTDKVNN